MNGAGFGFTSHGLAAYNVGMKAVIPFLLPCVFLLVSSDFVAADSATWKTSPASNDWNTAQNWDPEVVPTEVATFGASNVRDLSVTARASVGTIAFTAGANP